MPTRLAVILIEKFADWEHGFLTSALRDFFGAEVRFYTPGGATVTSEGGMRAAADGAVETLTPDAFDGLAVIGSGVWMKDGAPDISALVQSADKAGRLLGFICGGTIAAARAGLLDNRPHTSNDADTPKKSSAYHGASHYRDVPHAVRDSNLITAPGFAPRSFAYEMVAALVPGEKKGLGFFKQELTAEKFG
ncbi:putative protease YdeA [Alphaproteobacteria bacterium SO-S41]|nr:putative protease YdeA [Alphaproteobacteria bacterium SO-S41]